MSEDERSADEEVSSRKNTKETEGNFLISSCIVITCLTGIVSLVYLLYYLEDSAGKMRKHATVRTCRTLYCDLMSQQLSFSMDGRIPPCTDFVSHVCSGWVNSAAEANTVSTAIEVGFFLILELKLKMYRANRNKQDIVDMTAILFQSCTAMNGSHTIDKLKKVLGIFHLKNWPNFDYTDSGHFDVFAEILKADLKWNMNLVFKAERVYRFDIGKPRVSFLPTKQACPYRSDNASLEQEYTDYVKEIFRIFGYQSAVGTGEVASLHMSLCNFTRAPFDNDYQYLESVLNLTADLGLTTDKWIQHLKPLGNLTEKSIVYTNLHFVSSALQLLTQNITTVQVMRYMGYMIANQFAATDSRVQEARDSRPFLTLWFPRLKNTMVTPCLHEVMYHFLHGWNVFTLLASNPNHTMSLDVVHLIHTILAATQRRVRTSTWVDEESKAITLNKLKKASVVGPVAAIYMAVFEVHERYAKLKAFTDDYYDNLLKIKQNDAAFRLSGKKRYAREGNFASVGIDADHATNTFYIFAGLLNVPYYSESLPLPVKYGGIGTWIAKALAQALTRKGAKTGALGTSQHWWLGNTYREYLRRKQCFAKKTNSSSASVRSDYTDSYLAVRIAYDAMMTAVAQRKVKWELPNMHLSDANMFFLTYCLGICSTTERDGKVVLTDLATNMCNGAVNNMPEFREAWQCDEMQQETPGPMCELY
ncbi:neprilysin-1-like [Ornithodoros turicata]|uniref:neprilysin-1-like n=1 Tax=Ornithodoros turicata TaxID=34597 RepID=UPI00313868A4